jgi:hypothetical protein
MIEAVNSVLANAPLLRGNAEQNSSVRAVQVEAVNRIPQAPYVSPYIYVDNNFNKAVLQIRDSDTGDVLRQFPTEQRLETIRQQQFQETRQQRVQSPAPRQPEVPVQAVEQEAQPSVQTAQVAAPAQDVASSQVAAAALSSAAQTAQPSSSAGVFVTA